MTDAEVRELSEAFRLIRREGSLSPYTCDRVIAIAQVHLRLKAAVRLVHARYDPGDVGPEPKDFSAAVLLLEHVAKEPPYP